MFSFHKPRVYRSVNGCCICRAKSSSSRFTDSKRYEEDFYDCFKLDEKRGGEICNACVLLVKRWKKLPRGSERNWQHVVDARAGHGSKLMSKIKKVKKEKAETEEKHKDFFIPKLVQTTREKSPSEYSDDVQYCISNESYDSSLAASPVPSPEPMDEENTIIRTAKETNSLSQILKSRVKRFPQKNLSTNCSFLDLDFWKREKTCCGIIFKGPHGEVLLDRRFLKPCHCRSGTTSPASISPESESIPDSACFSCEDEVVEETSDSKVSPDKVLMESVNRIIPSTSSD